MRRIIRISIFTVAALVALAAAGVWYVGRTGSSAVEGWIGAQLQEMVNARLNPQLQFDSLDYTYPASVSVQNLRLVADHDGQAVAIIRASQAQLTLAKTPRVGEPIVLEQIILQQPEVRLIALAPRSKKLVGFSDFVRDDAAKDPAKRRRLSEVLQIRLIRIDGGAVVYDPLLADAQPMRLDDIHLQLAVSPDEAGRYLLNASLLRRPLLEWKVRCQLDADARTLHNIDATMSAEVKPQDNAHLPPQLAKLLQEHEVTGRLAARIAGSMPLKNAEYGNLSGYVQLTDAHVAIGEHRCPVDRLSAELLLGNGQLVLQSLSLDALGGSASASGVLGLADPSPLELDLSIRQMRLEHTLRTKGKYAGVMDATLLLQGVPVDALKQQSDDPPPALPDGWGEGGVRLEEAKLMNVPVIDPILRALRHAAAATQGEASRPSDRLRLDWVFRNDRLDFRDITYIGDVVAARGRGTMTLRGLLDLEMNGGPLEKMQSMLAGPIGDVFGALTDAVATYHVTGPVKDPHVRLKLGGGIGAGVEKIGAGVEKGMEELGKGVGHAGERIIKSLEKDRKNE
jgi:hypothetical protein